MMSHLFYQETLVLKNRKNFFARKIFHLFVCGKKWKQKRMSGRKKSFKKSLLQLKKTSTLKSIYFVIEVISSQTF